MSDAHVGAGAEGISRRTFVGLAAALGALASTGALAGCAEAATPEKALTPSRASALRESSASSTADAAAKAGPAVSTTAVVYFSEPLVDAQERDADSGASVVMSGQDVLGNVQFVAQFVAQATGGDLLRIETQEPYPTNEDIFDYALAEQNENARPAISLVRPDGTVADSLDAYDTVCVGYPIWWYELPMPLYTFFGTYDLAGKRVAPFVVHGGSGLSGTVQDIEGMQPAAQVERDGLSINRDVVEREGQADAEEWVGRLGLSR